MSLKNLSGIAVLDAEHKLIGQTSSSDLKAWLRKQASLKQNIADFLIAVRQSEVGDIRYPIVSVTSNSSIHHCFARLVATRLHRVFVTDPNGKVRGVISLSDMLRCVINQVAE